MLFPITSIFAVILALVYLLLSAYVHGLRKETKITLGAGEGNETLQRAVRAHGNFSEYVPFGLLLMLLVESTPWGAGSVMSIGTLLLVGRVLHALSILGYEQRNRSFLLRIGGVYLTWAAIALAAYTLFTTWLHWAA